MNLEEIYYKKTKNKDTLKLKTGDLVLFSGKGAFSVKIQLATLSIYSHVGIIVKLDKNFRYLDTNPSGEGADEDGLYLFHSINGKIPCVKDFITGVERDGVQLNSLAKILKQCNADIHIRRLKVKGKNKKEIIEKELNANDTFSGISQFISASKSKPYELYLSEMAKATIFFMPAPNDDNNSYFCSELVAAAYKATGVLPEHANASEYIPKDFGIMCDTGKNKEEMDCYRFLYGSGSYDDGEHGYSNALQPSIESTGCKFKDLIRIKWK